MVYISAIGGCDNGSKNLLWVTYDGTVWTPVIYDLDGTWGMSWDGEMNVITPDSYLLSDIYSSNELWKKLYENFREDINQRYLQLRQNVLSYDNIVRVFDKFFSQIPNIVRDAERKKWPEIPNSSTNFIDPIYSFTKQHLKFLDKDVLGYELED